MICAPNPERTSASSAGRAVVALWVLTVCVAACDSGSDTPTAPSPGNLGEATGAASPVPGGHDPLEMPPPGQLRLRILDEGITLLANGAPRGPLLEVLALKLGFELDASDLSDEPVVIELQLGELEEILPQLLPDRAYRVDYRFDPEKSRHRVARLQVASPGESKFGSGEEIPTGDAVPAATETQPTESDDAKTAESEIDWKALVAKLDASDPDDRIEALEKIDPEGEGLPLIVDRLAHDPDPRVRVVAAEQLEFSDTLAGVDALVGALSDPHRDVILAAIDALELTDDYTVTQDLNLLLEHPDTEIRKAAREAIDFIEPDEDDAEETDGTRANP